MTRNCGSLFQFSWEDFIIFFTLEGQFNYNLKDDVLEQSQALSFCETWAPHNAIAKDSRLLDFYALLVAKYLPKFRSTKISPEHRGTKTIWNIAIYKSTRHHTRIYIRTRL
jgi:hypothetical protein